MLFRSQRLLALELERPAAGLGLGRLGGLAVVLDDAREQALRADPLTGWAGSGDTDTQIRLTFASKDEALAYAAKKGLEIHLVPAPPVSLKIQTYADNFK